MTGLDEAASWSERDRARLAECLQDAASELQRVMLQRAVGAGHSAAEVHAFADAIRELSDESLFSACSVSEQPPSGATVEQLLRAEGDPLSAFELNGGALDPTDPTVPVVAAPRAPVVAPTADPRLLRYGQGRVRDLSPAPSPSSSLRGARPSAPRRPPNEGAGASTLVLADLLNAAGGGRWHEVALDTPSGLTLEAGLAAAARQLEKNTPVPAVLGSAPGVDLAFVVLMQRSVSASTRAWQLYAPRSNELVWVNEADLLARTELPFDDPSLRRLTRLVLEGA